MVEHKTNRFDDSKYQSVFTLALSDKQRGPLMGTRYVGSTKEDAEKQAIESCNTLCSILTSAIYDVLDTIRNYKLELKPVKPSSSKLPYKLAIIRTSIDDILKTETSVSIERNSELGMGPEQELEQFSSVLRFKLSFSDKDVNKTYLNTVLKGLYEEFVLRRKLKQKHYALLKIRNGGVFYDEKAWQRVASGLQMPQAYK